MGETSKIIPYVMINGLDFSIKADGGFIDGTYLIELSATLLRVVFCLAQMSRCNPSRSINFILGTLNFLVVWINFLTGKINLCQSSLSFPALSLNSTRFPINFYYFTLSGWGFLCTIIICITSINHRMQCPPYFLQLMISPVVYHIC